MNNAPKPRLLHLFARVAHALASPARLELLDLLAQGEKTVDLLARQSGLSVTNTSNHLKELRSAGLVDRRRDGTFMHYRLGDPTVHALVRSLQDVARRQLAEVDRIVGAFLDDPEGLDPISGSDLLARMREGDVVVLDVRPADEYAAGHLPGAVSMPLAELTSRLTELPEDTGIVAYCRGPYCVFAHEAVTVLRAHGFEARRLTESVRDWEAAGNVVMKGPEP